MTVKDLLDFVNNSLSAGPLTLDAELIVWGAQQDDWSMPAHLKADEDWLRIIGRTEMTNKPEMPVSDLDSIVDNLAGRLSYNLGKIIELIFDSYNSPLQKEDKLRLAAHYLGLELDRCLAGSTDEIEWDEVSEPKRNRLNEKPDPDSFL